MATRKRRSLLGGRAEDDAAEGASPDADSPAPDPQDQTFGAAPAAPSPPPPEPPAAPDPPAAPEPRAPESRLFRRRAPAPATLIPTESAFASPTPPPDAEPHDASPPSAPPPWEAAPVPEPEAAPEPPAPAPPRYSAPDPSDFGAPPEPPPPAPDEWGKSEYGSPGRFEEDDPFAARQDEMATEVTGVDVHERRNQAGRHYTDTGRHAEDTTDQAWQSTARAGDPSLPPGWNSPQMKAIFGGGGKLQSRQAVSEEAFRQDPPTEEVREDLNGARAPVYTAPMNVPEPPPIPGLFDRFTPPPVARKVGSEPARPDNRPKYEATPRPAPRADPPKPAAKPPPKPAPEDDDDDDEPQSSGPPVLLIAAGLGALFLGAVVVGLGVIAVLGNNSTPPAPPPSVLTVQPDPVQPEPPPPEPPPVEDPAVADPGLTTAPPNPTPEKPPTVQNPKPKEPKKPPPPAKSTGTTGTIKIRSNRRVLIKVNGQPRDYSPLDLPISPGGYTVSAALPGKPESEQSFKIDLSSGETEAVNFAF